MTMNTETQNQTFARVAAKTGVALTLAVAMALPAVAANAETFKAQNRVTVTTQGDGVFYAPMANQGGARGTWCAAADYATEVLGANGHERLYVVAPKTTNSGPTGFALDPQGVDAMPVSGLSAGLRTKGANLSVSHAYQFCHDSRIIGSR